MAITPDFNKGAEIEMIVTAVKNNTGNRAFPVCLEGFSDELGPDTLFAVAAQDAAALKPVLDLLPRIQPVRATVQAVGSGSGETAGYTITALKPL